MKKRIYRGWSDAERKQQLRRLRALKWLPNHFREAATARSLAVEHCRSKGKGKTRVPSQDKFSAVLGLLKAASDFGIAELELSAADIAELTGNCLKTIQRVLNNLLAIRWIERARRMGQGAIDGVWKRMYRTSKTCLSAIGRAALGIGQVTATVKHVVKTFAERFRASKKTKAPKTASPEPLAIAPDCDPAPSWQDVATGVQRLPRELREIFQRQMAAMAAG